jgi:hypothetical protein
MRESIGAAAAAISWLSSDSVDGSMALTRSRNCRALATDSATACRE